MMKTRALIISTSLPAFQLHRVLKMMDASLDEGIKVGKLAAAVKMSGSQFSRLFKGNTGFSPFHPPSDVESPGAIA